METPPEHLVAITDPAVWLLLSMMLTATSGLLAWPLRRWPAAADRVGAAILGIGAAVGLLAAAAACIAGQPPSLERAWNLPWGRFSIALDGLSAAFLFPVLAVPALAGFYGVGAWPQRARGRNATWVRCFLGLLTASMSLLVVARDAVLFLIAFEVMTLSTFFLVTTEDEKREVRDAGWVYFAASHLGFVLMLGLWTGFRSLTGTFDLDPIAPGTASVWARTGLFLAALVAFGVKAGVMPLHVWLPAAHANAPSHVSAVLSGVVIKIGIYSILRVLAMLPEPPLAWGVLLLVLGATSGVAGVVFAIGQHDLKRLLAYHSIENIGIIVMGIGLAVVGRAIQAPVLVVLGFGAAILHVWNHAAFKSLLFLSAGVVVHAAGRREIDRLGGLGRVLPWSAALFTLGAVAICGLPPLNGFVSEFILFLGAFQGLQPSGAGIVTIAAPVLALIGGLACACFVKVIGTVFLGLPRTDAGTSAHECGGWMRGPMLVLALLCVALGTAPLLVAPALDAATRAWMGADAAALPALATLVPFAALAIPGVVVALVAAALCWVLVAAARAKRTVGTWDCGYLQPGPRMQYTGSSIGSGLVGLFRFLLRPHTHEPAIAGPFPRPSTFREHVDDVVLQRWVLPLVRWGADRCRRLRTLQSARIQTYIAYVLVATLALLFLAVPLLQHLRELVTK